MAARWDGRKNAEDIARRGTGFERFDDMDRASILVIADTRKDYGEERWTYYGMPDGHLHQAAVTFRHGQARMISLRLASRKERRKYEEAIRRGYRRD